jgi:hypothetical protein
VQWSIEKRRGKAGYRREMIARWRKAIGSWDFQERWDNPATPFAATPEYAELRAFLDEEFRTKYETGRTVWAASGRRGDSYERAKILDTIAAKEREWGLL